MHLPTIDLSARLSQKQNLKTLLYLLRLEKTNSKPRWFSLPKIHKKIHKNPPKSMTPVVQSEIPGIYGWVFFGWFQIVQGVKDLIEEIYWKYHK